MKKPLRERPICMIDGCDKSTVGRGWCRRHYTRWSRRGDPEAPLRKTADGTLANFILANVSYAGDECLIWPFVKYKNGYGFLNYKEKRWGASRLMCTLVNGPPPSDRHETAHSCGKGHLACIAPKHVTWKTPIENQADRIVHGTTMRGSQCPQAKLTERDVENIIRRLNRGETQQSIADSFGVAQTTIAGINNGKGWGWLTGRAA